MGSLVGSIAGSLFGGSGGGSQQSQSRQSSDNQAFPMLSAGLAPQMANATGSSNQMANLLGLNGGPAQTQGFDNWRNSTGYRFGMDQGVDAITGSAAAKGLLNSGATLKGINQFGQNYANTQFGNYFDQLLGLGNQGNQAASIIGGAGNRSQMTQSSSGVTNGSGGGLGGFVGSLLSK